MRKAYIEDVYNQLSQDDNINNTDRHRQFDNKIRAFPQEIPMIEDAKNKLSAGTNRPRYNNEYVTYGRMNVSPDRIPDGMGAFIQTSGRYRTIDSLPIDIQTKLKAYRFGSDSKRYNERTASTCPDSPEKFTPIMYDERDTKTWPWQVNRNYEDPIVDRQDNIMCCNKTTRQYDLVTKKLTISSQRCTDLYKVYKEQENNFVDYMNRFITPMIRAPISIFIAPEVKANMDLCVSDKYSIVTVGDPWERHYRLTLSANAGNLRLPSNEKEGDYFIYLYDDKKQVFIDLLQTTFYKDRYRNTIVDFWVPSIFPMGKYSIYVFKEDDRLRPNTYNMFDGRRRYYNNTCIHANIEVGGRSIFQIIDLCEEAIRNNNNDVMYLLFETYDMFLSQPTRLQYFTECVCRGDYGHEKIRLKIDQFRDQVENMLTNTFQLNNEEVNELIGANGILRKFSEKIDIYNHRDTWLDTTKQTLRALIEFYYRSSIRLGNLVVPSFNNTIIVVIDKLLRQISFAGRQEIRLLDLLPSGIRNTNPSSMNNAFFYRFLDILCKDNNSMSLILNIQNLVLGEECQVETIARFLFKMFEFARKYDTMELKKAHFEKYKPLARKLLLKLPRDCLVQLRQLISSQNFKDQLFADILQRKPDDEQARYHSSTEEDKRVYRIKELLIYHKPLFESFPLI